MTDHSFILSIETTEGSSHWHGFHLGTIPSIAKQIAVDVFKARVENKEAVVTVALLQHGKIYDVFYGDKWDSEREIT